MNSATPPPGDKTPYELLGGREVTLTLAERFYDAMETDAPALAALHQRTADGRISPETRIHFGSFLCFWLGGPTDYLTERGHPRLRMRHAPFPIDSAMADAWIACMQKALNACDIGGPVRSYLDARFTDVAYFLRNRPDEGT